MTKKIFIIFVLSCIALQFVPSPLTDSAFLANNSNPGNLFTTVCWTIPQTSLLSPTNGTIINQTGATFTWNSGSTDCAVAHLEYRFQLSTDSSFSSFVVDSAWSTDLSFQYDSLADGTYWWRVEVRDQFGNSSFAGPRTLTVDTISPSSPTNLQWKKLDGTVLPCGSTTNSYNIIADWDDAVDQLPGQIDHYEYTITYPELDGTPGIWSTVITASQYVGVFGMGEGLHTYKVRAYDKAGNVSSWSSSCSMMYDKTAPLSPRFWTEEDTTEAKIDWNASTDAVGYRVYRSSDDMTYTQVADVASLTFTDTGLTTNTDYYYKVTAYDAAGNESDLALVTGKYTGTMDIVVDDNAMDADFSSSGFVSSSGVWGIYNMNNYPNILQNAAGGDNFSTDYYPVGQTYTWETNAGLTGFYDVYVQYICDPARNVAQYSIFNGVTQIGTGSADQRLRPDQLTACGGQASTGTSEPKWTKLGNYRFTGASGKVVLNAGTNPGYILADAVGFKKTADIDATKPTSIITTGLNLNNDNEALKMHAHFTNTFDWNGVINGTATDDNSGVKEVQVSVYRPLIDKYWNGTAWVNGTETGTRVSAILTLPSWNYHISNHPTGIYIIKSHAIDNEGNVEDTYTLTLENSEEPETTIATEEATLSPTPTLIPTISPTPTIAASQPTVALTMSDDKKTISFTVSNINDVKLSYTLSYDAYSSAKGVVGNDIDVTGLSEYKKEEIDLATCSGSVCTYDQNVANIKLTVTLVDKDGKETTLEKSL